MEGVIEKFPFLKERQLLLAHAEHLVGFNHELRVKLCLEILVPRGEIYYREIINGKERFTPYYRGDRENGIIKLKSIFQVFYITVFNQG